MKDKFSDCRLSIEWGRDKSLTLEWDILDHAVSFFWLKLFHSCLSEEISLNSRYVGFLQGPRDQDFVGNLLNECIDTINEDGRYFIEDRYEGEITQELLHEVHHHFSTLMGDEFSKSQFWIDSNTTIHSAICGLNDYIHELESWQSAVDVNEVDEEITSAYVTSRFFEAKGIEIQDDWNHLFSLDGQFGDLTLHYDQIGKTWLEVLLERDEVIIEDDIRPLSRLTGSFNINFFETDREYLLDTITPYALSKGIELEDSSLRLGHCCLGRLRESNMDREELISLLSKNLDISSITLMQNEEVIIRKEIPKSKERYFYSKNK
ncbi:hypothetical protein BMS_1933 [Halobacteriovorax marinus SJ]|uniref:Uncharacterized protein n=1 Tax=Halobacteriovorax marinus (strain ATCC BAA-682 / DSM 15412 / SJ) TaxID=862908 RepID=E1X2I2_HALMS|nr:hypothetical protein [Halobacteriovorax marinus]CBW26749.1 hypothetical protein BMS_1933 [Halobacteriovorax marinus SJ]